YQSTTAVAADAATLDQPSASIAREASAGPTQMTLHTPTGWQWEKNSSRDRASVVAERSSAAEKPASSRRTTWVIVASAGAIAIILVAIGVTRTATKSVGARDDVRPPAA